MSLSRFMGRVRLSMRNHSPQIMFIGGTIAMGAAIVEAFKARPKYDEVIEEYHQMAAKQKRAAEIADDQEDGDEIYPAERRLGDKIHDGLVTGMKLAVVFGKVIAFGGIALGCFFGYGRIYRGWFVASAAVAEGATRKLKALEAATVAEVGKDKMQDIKDRMFKEEAEKRYSVDEDGERIIKDADVPTDHPSFLKWFDEANKDNFKKGDPDANLNYLLNKLELLNIRLHAKGYLMANDVFQELKMQKTTWGQIYGILAENEDGTKNYLDFGLYDGKDPAARNFVNGYEDVFLLNFNFDPKPIVGRVKEFTNLPY